MTYIINMTKRDYTVEPVSGCEGVSDVRIFIEGKKWHLWGRMGVERETVLAENISAGRLPVLFGAGLGICLEKMLESGPVAVVDNDPLISQAGGADRLRDHPDVTWVSGDPASVLERVRLWRSENGGSPLEIVKIPLYLRLDRQWYAAIADTLEAEKDGSPVDFWGQVKYPKFRNEKPRVLFFNRPYFLTGEIKAAMERIGLSYCSIDIGTGDTVREGFVEDLLKSVVDFKPDFVLTVNHFGVDREGKLTDLLLKLKLPLASWFVDNPQLILYRYKNVSPELSAIFTYDAGNLDIMREKGFQNIFYLPLATDPQRFKPGVAGKDKWRSEVSFVGNSMVDAVEKTIRESGVDGGLREQIFNIAAEFGEADELSVEKFLKNSHPDLLNEMEKFPTDEHRLSFEALITWEATRQYRLSCVKEVLQFNPLIVGDSGWHTLLQPGGWRYLSSVDYYEDLPAFYPMSKVSFNCTSRQMKGAVNQRVFDVPACGGFVLTDYREQMDNLFDPDTEIISYKDVAEIPQMTEKWLADEGGRKKVSDAARKRIISEHTYEHRLINLMDKMRKTFG
ncbi:CgeB family protein [Maridesulfovibrio hydrothermalis]|uniref:CgeB family protein n=1 Tax=Maridesulfovibrio hydrothermalis AM13 = DSM 14728 TaxID=1121451 RepID=L0RDD7_9BACT|nr:glycosyltransferase [Maridesulfovibrio hydrothermalis]CCO24215.1 CgeB family protein [Maridesulfovibrio hydrothermalis AM13 = DSM 14728]